MEASVSITGVERLDRIFKQMPAATQNKAMRPALRKGATVIRDGAKQNLESMALEDSTGVLARSLRVYSLRKFKGMLRVAVMIKRGLTHPTKRDKNGPVRVGLYGSVLEYRPGKSWLRKAARERTAIAFQEIAQEATVRIAKVVGDLQ